METTQSNQEVQIIINMTTGEISVSLAGNSYRNVTRSSHERLIKLISGWRVVRTGYESQFKITVAYQ